MSKRILIILGHPIAASLCGALADAYESSARSAGHEVRKILLGDLAFDPVLRHGYEHGQPMEPDLQAAQAAITWAQHLVFVYPTWWGAMPALLKGFIDRTFLPGFAFSYRENSPWWDRLLAGKSAHLIVTMDTPRWYYRWIYRSPGHNQMKKTILEFCGIRPVAITSFGAVRSASDKQCGSWIRQVEKFAASV